MLSGDNVHSWILADFLVWLHLGQEVSGDTEVMPGDVPLSLKFLVAFIVYYSTFVVLFKLF